jgi:hypothetical protein
MPRSKSSEGDKEDKVLVEDAPKRDSDEAKSDGAMERPSGAEEPTTEKEVRAAQSEPKEGQVTDVAQPDTTDSTEVPPRYSAMLAQNSTRTPPKLPSEVQAAIKEAAKKTKIDAKRS